MDNTHEVPDWETPTAKPSLSDRVKNVFSKPSATPPPPISKESPTDAERATAPPVAATPDVPIPTPTRRTYFGRSRRTFFLALGAIIVLIILAIGLGAGLGTKHSKSSKDLPLPSNGGIFTGDLTYYQPGLGACGIVSSSTQSICAVSHIIFDVASTSGNPNDNPLCGKMIRITRYDSSVGSNRSADVEVVDRCVGCKADDLDLSLSVFDSLAEEAQGRVVGSWAWLS